MTWCDGGGEIPMWCDIREEGLGFGSRTRVTRTLVWWELGSGERK
jgi:hypothetical protein